MINGDMWVGLVNPELIIFTSDGSYDCDDKFKWLTELTDELSAAAPLEGNVEADGDGTCFAMANKSSGSKGPSKIIVRDQSCLGVAQFTCEFTCDEGEMSTFKRYTRVKTMEE